MPWRDRSLDVLVKGYPALSQLRRAAARRDRSVVEPEVADAVAAPLLGRRALCVGGPAGVRLFYDQTLTTRRGALPGPVGSVLFGSGAVHGLDGGAHRQRKALFLSLLGPKAAQDLARVADRHWQAAATRWQDDWKPFLFDEAVRVFSSAVCEWAGVPPHRHGPDQYRDLATIVDGFGSMGLRHLAARRARVRANRWAAELIDDTRTGQIQVPESAGLAVVTRWRDEGGELLDTSVAAVELLNVLRPATAVSWFVVFAALALDDHPDWRIRLNDAGEPEALKAFAHEVRRLYPFAPMLAARARTAFDWHGHHVPAGRRLVLDLFGTLHDETNWPEPERFDPERFLGSAGAAAFSDAYIPHGGGDPVDGHRCPGEPATLALLEGAIRVLVSTDYRLEGPRRLRLNRMPVRAKVVLTDIGLTQRGRQSNDSAAAF